VDFHGNIQLNNNLMKQMVLETETATGFPDTAIPGRLIFIDKRVYICAELINGFPFWVPLTNIIDTYIHSETIGATTWNINHNMRTTVPLVQIYDENMKYIMPDDITIVDGNNITVTFSSSAKGRCVIMHGTLTGSEQDNYSYSHIQTNVNDTWIIPHNLGYYPVVRVFVGSSEIQPTSIVHSTSFETVITFSMPYTGTARMI